MAKTNWQDPKTGEIRSTHVSGLQEAVGKIEDSISMQTVAGIGITLSEVYISSGDRYRIYQAPEGKRNWVSSPAPVMKKNGSIIASGFEIDYGGGAIIFGSPILDTDTVTVDATYTTVTDITYQVFDDTQNGLVPKPTSPTGKVLNDYGDWVDNIVTKLYNKTITDTWSDTSGGVPYYQEITCAGMKDTDTPIISLDFTGVDITDVNDLKYAWSSIYDITTDTDKLIVYSLKELSIELDIVAKVVR